MSSKSEKPTKKRLEDARTKGQLPRSRLLAAAAPTLGGLIAFFAFLPEGVIHLRAWTQKLFVGQSLDAKTAFEGALEVMAWLSVPALAGALLASFVVSTAVAGLRFQLELVSPKLERVSPAAGFRRLFSIKQLVEILKGVVVTGLLGWLAWSFIEDHAREAFEPVQAADAATATGAVLLTVRRFVLGGAALLMVLAVGDYLLARRRHLKDLMMSREEVKEEFKQAEGDPNVKAQRRAQHRRVAAGGAARGVQTASVVVVNPTHIAVALRYDERECEAPYLVAKGEADAAKAIRDEAKALGVPVVKDVPLARSLVRFDVGEEIPEELYRAAAAVLKTALEVRGSDAGLRSRT